MDDNWPSVVPTGYGQEISFASADADKLVGRYRDKFKLECDIRRATFRAGQEITCTISDLLMIGGSN